ncbi:spermatogenesis-associated protein 7 isoform X2 [Trichosurus vulpecula]|uniref:spermatogenesis-associated protein 7 isoform X2 n=1 Tax=Trichosurus vulpecula TaxID=9337 RepID=UPI00186AEE55|nr:spermatogenesis-associated protein 7 isoform X2 [Trichosurus vulpecula]
MGGKNQDNPRRVRANLVIPRYGPSSPFTGHLSIKSNAFCTDSSSLRLSTLYLIKNHMAVHYNKILSAKAVVDCSMPVSMTSSIKYSDQQRREKLKKELAQFEKELKLARMATQTSNRLSSSPLSSVGLKLSEESQDKEEETEEENEFPSLSKSLPPASDRQFPDFSNLEKTVRNETRRTYSTSGVTNSRRQFSGPSYNVSSGSGRNTKTPRKFQLFTSKAPSGDLLEKHSARFTNKQLPFTPRTLKTEAKSFLSQYRYYTPAKRKKSTQDQLIEAETQTDLSSFKTHFVSAELNNIDSEEVIINEPKISSCEMKEKIISSLSSPNNLGREKVKEDVLHYPLSREEELLYLSFIEDVTDEILKLGLFSNRVLERLFEHHIERNKHHLEEKKMRHMLHVLKVDLGCTTPEEKSEKINGTLNVSNLFDFEKLGIPEEIQLTDENEIPVSPSKSKEYQNSLDLQDKILDANLTQKEMASPSSSNASQLSSKDKCSEDNVSGQVISETSLEPSAQSEEPSVSYTTSDPVSPTESFEEGDNDLEKTESLSALGKTHLEECVQNSIKEDDDHDTKEATSKLTEAINEQYPLDN